MNVAPELPMFDAIVGAVIMVVATTSLLSAIEILEQSFNDSARHPLDEFEINILERAGLDQNEIEQFYNDNLKNLPKDMR